MQLRDFVYVKDVIDVLYFMMIKRPSSGLYNLEQAKQELSYTWLRQLLTHWISILIYHL